jgi:hypothetical protein
MSDDPKITRLRAALQPLSIVLRLPAGGTVASGDSYATVYQADDDGTPGERIGDTTEGPLTLPPGVYVVALH